MQKFVKLRRDTPVPPKNVPPRLFLSNNAKTGLSINVSIALSCRPTEACSQYCYGLEGRIRFKESLNQHVNNYTRFEYLAEAPPIEVEREAVSLVEKITPRQDFLRFFGVGDLQRGSARFINIIADVAPGLDLWVSTRKFDLAETIVSRPNIHCMLSLDSITKPAFVEQAHRLVKQRPGRFYAAWAQQSYTDTIPPWVKVVFAEHHCQSGRALWTESHTDRRTCPATVVDGAEHDGACAACRYCFSTEQRETGFPTAPKRRQAPRIIPTRRLVGRR